MAIHNEDIAAIFDELADLLEIEDANPFRVRAYRNAARSVRGLGHELSAWMAEGNCRLHPPATFFPSDGVGVDKARKICRGCPVATTCLEYALENRIDHGVWGGCSERERRRILKTRRQEEAAARVDEFA